MCEEIMLFVKDLPVVVVGALVVDVVAVVVVIAVVKYSAAVTCLFCGRVPPGCSRR